MTSAATLALPAPAALPQHAREVQLVAYPQGDPRPDDFSLVTRPLPEPQPGEFLVRNVYLGIDAYMRYRMGAAECGQPRFPLGQPPAGVAVGRVAVSQHRRFSPGDWVATLTGWREYGLSDGRGVLKIDPAQMPPAACLGVLGIPGVSAYLGLLEIAQVKAGETVFVSAAAGAVGTAAVQIARLKGCRVIASTGSDSKAAFLREELGAAAAFNYKRIGLAQALSESCPDGVDVYFDNVGGAQLGATLAHMRPLGRVVLCGMVSQYNLAGPAAGVDLFPAIYKRLTLRGFVVSDHFMRLPLISVELAGWLREDRLRSVETCVDGLENAPQALLRLLRGETLGKTIVRVSEPAP